MLPLPLRLDPSGRSPRKSPSLRHQLLAWAVPRLRGAGELDTPDAERARLERWHAGLDRSLPTRSVPGFDRRFTLQVESVPGSAGDPAGEFASYVVTPRGRAGRAPRRTVVYLHGGGFVAPFDAAHVRWTTRLARALDAQVVLPDYPLAPEHTWRDSHDALVDLVAGLAADGPVVLAGDSAGGGLALAVALGLRRRGGPQPTHLLLLSPWVDLTASTAAPAGLSRPDPWLFRSKLTAYAAWWAGAPDDLARPEVSPALADPADLAGLPPTLVLCGTRDLLVAGCRLLAARAAEGGWDLTYVEEPDLIHVYPLLPFLPEARRAWRQGLAFLGAGR